MAKAIVRGVEREPGVIHTCSMPFATRLSTNAAEATSTAIGESLLMDGLEQRAQLDVGLGEFAVRVAPADDPRAGIELGHTAVNQPGA